MTPGSTVLPLVRHGEAESNVSRRIGGHTPAPLTALGRRQARAAATALAATEPTAVVSSDLTRARQTADIIAEACALPVTLDPRLRERSLGDLDGLLADEAAERFPALWAQIRARDPRACPPNAESVAQVFDRVSRGIDDIARDHAGGRVVVVSHGIALLHALVHILGAGDPARGLSFFTLVGNASISTVAYRDTYWLIEAINDRAHLRDVIQ